MRLIDADRMKDNIKVGGEKVNSQNIDNGFDCVVKPKVLIEWIDSQPTVDAIPVSFIELIYKEAIKYRDRFPIFSDNWERANDQAVGIWTVLDEWKK